MAAPRAGAEDVEIEMDEPNHHPYPPQQPSSLPPSVNPSLDVSRAESDLRTEDMSDYGADRETIGMRYACPNLGCGTTDKKVYSNPQYAQNNSVPGKKRYPTLDRPPSRAASQNTVNSTNQSTADLVGKKGDPGGKSDSGLVAGCKSFWKNPRYDKLRAIVLIVILVILLLLIIILPIVLRKPSAPEEKSTTLYELVWAKLAVCGDMMLEGYKRDGVSEFRGIPYALPPLEDRRWQPSVPLDAQNCKTVTYTKADHYGHQCYQSTNVRAEIESEDCLYLNVWTPSNYTDEMKLPVMVYIHDGDFVRGSGRDIDRYPLRKIVKEGEVVLVSLNYRLQALGFMSLDVLDHSNAGLTDMVAALKWVQENIGGFGGDKSQVTLFGLGSGATSILALLNSNATTGLFHRAWLMSPGVVQDQALVASQTGNDAFITNLGCPKDDNMQLKRCMYSKNSEQIFKAVPWYEGPQWAQPMKFDVPEKNNKSGPFIVTDELVGGVGTFAALTAKSLIHKQIPIMLGNADAEADVRPPAEYFGTGRETKYLTQAQLDAVKAKLQSFDQDIMTSIQNDYTNLETERGFSKLVTDIRAVCPTNQMAQLFHDMGTEVYRYIYTMKPAMKVDAMNYGFWASNTFHGIDMLAFFGALDGEDFSPYFDDAKAFAEAMRAAVFGFVRGELTTWEKMPQVNLLTATTKIANDANSTDYHRKCAHWTKAGMNLVPDYAWSN